MNNKKILNLICEDGVFKDENGKDIKYLTFYVDVLGIKVKMKPYDATGKSLLMMHLSSIDDKNK